MNIIHISIKMEFLRKCTEHVVNGARLIFRQYIEPMSIFGFNICNSRDLTHMQNVKSFAKNISIIITRWSRARPMFTIFVVYIHKIVRHTSYAIPL